MRKRGWPTTVCAAAVWVFGFLGTQAQAAQGDAAQAWLPGGTPNGQAGMHRVLYGHAAARSGLTFAAGADIAYAQRLLFASDADELRLSRQTLALMWTAGSMFEVGLGVSAAVGTDAILPGVATSVLPALRLKYNVGLWQRWAWAVAAGWQAPPFSGSSGVLSPADATYTLQAAASRPLRQGWELSVNLGFIYDRAGTPGIGIVNPLQLVVDARNLTSRVSAGVGATRLFAGVWRQMALGPYAELTSEWAVRKARFVDNPVRLSVGTKAFFDAAHTFEADVGVDVRLLGASRQGGLLAGLPPWALFVAFSYHSRLAALDFGRQEVVYVPTYVHDKPRPTFVLSGYAHDANALMLQDARVSIGSDANVVFSVDPATGYYQSAALPVSDLAVTAKVAAGEKAPVHEGAAAIAVTCSAPGYLTQKQQLSVSAAGGPLRLDFHLQRKPPSAFLHLRAVDGKTGHAVSGTQAILVTSDALEDVPMGVSGGELRQATRPGRYTLMVTAPGYATVRRAIELSDDAELIVHVALQAKANSK